MKAMPLLGRGEQGVTYLFAMMVIVIMGITLTQVSQQWSVALKRDLEAELEFRGNRIKFAIEMYAADYQVRKGTRPNIYPLKLEQLVEGPKHYLQKVYKDPMTNEDFDLVWIEGEIHGVKSRSKDKPFSTIKFNDAERYDEIVFIARPPQGLKPRNCNSESEPTTPCR